MPERGETKKVLQEQGEGRIIDTPFMGRIRALGVGKDSIDDNGNILKDVFIRHYYFQGPSYIVFKVHKVAFREIVLQSGVNKGYFAYGNTTDLWYGNKIELTSQKDFDENPIDERRKGG